MQKKSLVLAVTTLLIGITITDQYARAQNKETRPASGKQKMISTQEPQLLACNMGAMTPAQRQRYNQIGKQLRKAVKQVKELPNGYAFRYAPDPTLFLAAAEFITLESRCCSFYKFSLEKEPGEGAMWLCVTGPKEAKTFIKPVLAP
jgi:hypothetical protein